MSKKLFIKTKTIIPVSDIYDTLEWYEKVLGLKTTYIHGSGRRGEEEDFANYAITERDGIDIHFILDEGGPVWTRSGTGHLSLVVSDVNKLYESVVSQGVAVARELKEENWPARGFELEDPSGNLVHIEQPL